MKNRTIFITENLDQEIEKIKRTILSLQLSDDEYTIVSTDTGNVVMTKNQRILFEKRRFVMRMHVRSDGSPRVINPPDESKSGALRFWNTLTADKKRLSAQTEDQLIVKLYDYYGGGYELKDTTFIQVFQLALAEYERKYPTRDRSQCNYQYVFNRCIDTEFANTRIVDITDDVLHAYCIKMIGKGDKRLNIHYFRRNTICMFNLVFNYAFRKRLIEQNPMAYLDKRYLSSLCKQNIKRPSEKRHSENEYDRILEEAVRRSKMTQFHGYYIYLFMIAIHQYLGCRPGELVALKWNDLYDGVVHFCHEQIEHKKPNTWYEYVDYTKNEKGVSRLGREFEIIPELQQIFDTLHNLQTELGIQSDFIFCDREGNWIPAKSYEKTLHSICTKLNIDSKGTYTFRRDVNNRMAEAGIEVFERALNMGHTPDVNTMCYDSPRRSKRSVLEKALGRGPSKVVTPW